jgi:hypothetical protein
MRFDCNEIGDIMSEVAAYGTAVTAEPYPPASELPADGCSVTALPMTANSRIYRDVDRGEQAHWTAVVHAGIAGDSSVWHALGEATRCGQSAASR